MNTSTAGAWTPETGYAEAERRIAACADARAEDLDLGGLRLTRLPEGLAELTWLKRLDLNHNRIGATEARALAALIHLTWLDLGGNRIGDYGVQYLAGLETLAHINLSNNEIGAYGLWHIAGLKTLDTLDLSGNRVGAYGTRHLADLTNLKALNLSANNIGEEGTRHLTDLKELTRLDLSLNWIGTNGAKAISTLARITSLNLARNQIGDDGTRALAALKDLSSLNLARNQIGAEGAQALLDHTHLAILDLEGNHIGSVGAQAVAQLRSLKRLNLWGNGIGTKGACALSSLTGLTDLSLSYNHIGVEGATALSALIRLTRLDLSNCNVTNLEPIERLPHLARLRLNGCHLTRPHAAFWMRPNLQAVYLHNGSIEGVPPELLSQYDWADCLPALRAHFADLSGGAVTIRDVKFMILGNGRVGKTQIVNRLRNRPYEENANSTHAIQIASTVLEPADDDPITLRIWDFGGQDIYLGTHALFLRTRALFMAVWATGHDDAEEHEYGGFTFRNYPLEYWVRYVRQMAGTEKPLLVVQTRCDTPVDEAIELPQDAVVRPLLSEFRHKPLLHYSARGPIADGSAGPRNHAALTEALTEAAQAVIAANGPVLIGEGRSNVMYQLDALRQQRTSITQTEFRRICDTANIFDPAQLLLYLADIGKVFYRAGLFNDEIVLDQQWALEAIYAVFQRDNGVFASIRDFQQGRFTRSVIGRLLWDERGYSPADQQLFISMMQQCGICFELKSGDETRGIDAVYVAPDLLPPAAGSRLDLLESWRDDAQTLQATYTYSLLPQGLLRNLMSRIGQRAGPAAEYWNNGFYFYDGQTDARAIVEQDGPEPDWSGTVTVLAQKGDAVELLARLCDLIDEENDKLGVAPADVQGRPPRNLVFDYSDRVREEFGDDSILSFSPSASIAPSIERSRPASPQYYVSYAWGGKGSEADLAREAAIERLCRSAEAAGVEILRDKDVMKYGDSISRFMREIARGDRVFVILSEKYLRSPYCMYELCQLWRECRQDAEELRERIFPVVLPDAQDIYDPLSRDDLQNHWLEQRRRYDERIRAKGIDITEDLARNAWMIREFALHTSNILALVADTLQPRDIEDIELLEFQ